MIPKKSKLLYKDVSEEMNVSENLVDSLIDFYYKELKNTLTNLEHPRVNVEGLGQFVIRKNLVTRSIPKYNKMLENHDTSTFKAYYNKKAIEERVQLLKKMQDLITKDSHRKEIFNQNKHEKYTQINLAKPERDTGGNNQ
jgi:nucleoid DNA-binding protein